MAHVAKYTRGALGHMFAHYERAKGKDNEYIKFGNENIDTSKSHLNYNLGPKRNISQGDFVKKRCNEVKCLNRKDVNVMCSWVITAPKDLDLKQQKKFFIESYKFLESRYGADNVISAYVHLDEVTPHMHFSFVPVIYDAKKDVLKVSAKQKISKSDLKSFHGDLQNHLDKVAIKCNIINEATRNGNKSIEELKRKTAIKEINEKKNYLNILICKIKEKEKELKYLSEKERKLSILLDEDIDKLEEQLKNLRENKEKIIWRKIRAHEEWVESDGLLGQQLNLENENLRGIRLINLDLREANLRNTDLRNSVIYADLRGADLTGAKIDNSDWVGSNINYMKIENDKLNFIENQMEQEKNWHLPSMKKLKTISKEKEMNI